MTLKELPFPELPDDKTLVHCDYVLPEDLITWNELDFPCDAPDTPLVAPQNNDRPSTLRTILKGETVRLINSTNYGTVTYQGKFVGKY